MEGLSFWSVQALQNLGIDSPLSKVNYFQSSQELYRRYIEDHVTLSSGADADVLEFCGGRLSYHAYGKDVSWLGSPAEANKGQDKPKAKGGSGGGGSGGGGKQKGDGGGGHKGGGGAGGHKGGGEGGHKGGGEKEEEKKEDKKEGKKEEKKEERKEEKKEEKKEETKEEKKEEPNLAAMENDFEVVFIFDDRKYPVGKISSIELFLKKITDSLNEQKQPVIQEKKIGAGNSGGHSGGDLGNIDPYGGGIMHYCQYALVYGGITTEFNPSGIWVVEEFL